MTHIRIVLLAILTLVNFLAHAATRYDNGRWFDGERFVARTMWSVDGVFREQWTGESDVVDLRTAYVIPPLADAHHHALRKEALDTFLAQGIFYVKNPNNPPSLTTRFPDVVYSNGGFTSTGGHPAQLYDAAMKGDAYHLVDRPEDLDRVWPVFLASKPDFVKIYLEGSRGLDPAMAARIVKRAHTDSLRVSAHVASRADFVTAVRAGVDEVNHLPLERLEQEDAALAAQHGTWVVTTTISHRPATGIQDLDGLHLHNIRLLRAAGVKIAIGTDDNRTAVAEAENLLRIGAFDRASLLRTWTTDTPLTIFPRRRLGRLADGYEASFLALAANPLEDFAAVRNVTLRVKQGSTVQVTAPKPLAADALAPIVMSKGVEAAIAEYDRMRADPKSLYDTGEQVLNTLGYALLRHEQIDAAIAVFQANVERFPRSWNVYDSLGEAYTAKGKKLKGASAPSSPPPHP